MYPKLVGVFLYDSTKMSDKEKVVVAGVVVFVVLLGDVEKNRDKFELQGRVVVIGMVDRVVVVRGRMRENRRARLLIVDGR